MTLLMQQTRPPHRPESARRRGALLLEVMISVVLLGLLLSLTAPVLKAVSQARRLTDQRRVAMLELSNLLEQVASWPRERVTVESIGKLTLSEATMAALPDAKLTSQAIPQTEPTGLMKIELALDWTQPGRETQPVRLTSWLAGK